MRRLLLAALALLVAGCQIPQDPDGTLERVENGTMRVGVTESDPWVTVEPLGGVEVELVRRFARDLNARVEWVNGGEEELVNALEEGSLDLVVGGMTSKSRWKNDVALTRPYVETKGVVGDPRARPVLDADDSPVAESELETEKHVMALPFGENAWMVRLERFLLNREDEIRRLVEQEGRP
jgi:polar amino acid transport system substrate-binding protein